MRRRRQDCRNNIIASPSQALKRIDVGTLSILLGHEFHEPANFSINSTVGAGVSIYDAYKYAQSNNGIVVGGNCPTVFLAGGYTQGGHGPLASKYGLAVDQVFEREVVTSDGSPLTASPMQNSDLYWALSGSGGGAYGVVVSLTVKVHPQEAAAAATLSFAVPNMTTGLDDFGQQPKRLSSHCQAWLTLDCTSDGFLGRATSSLLKKADIPYQYISQSFPTWLQSYEAFILPSANVSNAIIGSRLIPRSVIERQVEDFISALQIIA
ncbi:hypothetical protein UA08_02184 [Talaromyces atroroseus]|uniref:FAD-binding PCMH-type domain-containing protein n=1 Tax=Talaromyces atroroseus TaxID=1441469 RepID=A0A225B5H8_TALAT|nr:hypothetical protein UA08_02184 [Talaromyces atroroseus]OKL62125.1 hypothetical protein UA08_02184 [Talaromyces atroroseus]